jgi:hypothetical protein
LVFVHAGEELLAENCIEGLSAFARKEVANFFEGQLLVVICIDFVEFEAETI